MTGRARYLVVLGGILVTLVCVVGGYYLFAVAPLEARARRLSAELDAQLQAYRATGPVERPVLRGEPIEGNAVQALLTAAAPLSPVSTTLSDGLMESVHRGEVPARALAEAERHRSQLDTVRRAARHDHAWTTIPLEDGAAAAIPEYLGVLVATKLLLVTAAHAADECLDIGVDLIRLAHDLRPGGALVGAMIGVAMTRMTVPVMARCAHAADPEQRRRTAEHLRRLDATIPDLGGAFEAEALMAGATMRPIVMEAPLVPTSSEDFELWTQRGDALGAWEHFTREPARWRQITVQGYPASAEIWADEERARASSDNPLVSLIGPALVRYIDRDMDGVAHLRALIALLELLHEAPSLDPMPADGPAALGREDLVDPFTGDALRWLAMPEGRACIYSEGEDRVDGACGEEDARVLADPSLLPPAPEG